MQVYILIREWNDFCNGERIRAIINLDETLVSYYKKINVCMDEVMSSGHNWCILEKHY